MSDLTPYLDAVRARLKKATPGQWDYINRLIAEAEHCFNRIVVVKEGENLQDAHPICYQLTTDSDGALIAHAPTDLARLEALVRVAQDVINVAKGFDDKEACDPDSEGICQAHFATTPCIFAELRDALARWQAAVKTLETEEQTP